MGRNTKDQKAHAQDGYLERKYNVAPAIAAALPKVNRRRRAAALKSPHNFIATYCVGVICDYAPPRELWPIIDEMGVIAEGNGRYQLEMSRGIGKTTFVSGLGPYLVVKGKSDFIEVIAATGGAAGDIFDKMVAVFNGDKFREDFPAISIPFKMADRNALKMMRLTYNGKPLGMEQTADHLILPTIEGEPWSGAAFIIRGFTANNLRGVNILGKRPTFIILDDIQTDKIAKSPRLVAAAMERINSTILGQFGHKKGGAVVATATPQRTGDLTEAIKNDPAWITKVYPLVRKMPKNQAAWDEYAEVLRAETEALSKGEHPAQTANQYYIQHRKELDDGAEVLSEAIKERGEKSAIQHAMNLLLRLGPDAFSTEYQMKPIRSTSPYDFEYRDVIAARNGLKPGIVPRGFPRIIVGVDVMNASGLRYAIVAFGADRRAAVIGYGRYPADRSPLFLKTDPDDLKGRKISRAVASLLRGFSEARYKTEDGAVACVDAVGLDVGWKESEIRDTIEAFSRGDKWAVAMRGTPYAHFSPRTKTGRLRDNVESVSDEARAYTIKKPFAGRTVRTLCFLTDFWAEESQLAWKVPQGAPGSLTVCDGPALLEFAQECAADQLVDKPDGLWKWAPPDGPNHFGDCVKMAFALAAWKRVYLPSDKRRDALTFAGIEAPPRPSLPVAPRRKSPSIVCI